MFRYQKILIPLDGSKLAEQSLAPATAVAEAMQAHLILLQVVPPILMVTDPYLYEEMRTQAEQEADSYLNSLQPRLADVKIETVHEVVDGPVALSIIDYARENAVDLIVISSHGRSGVSRWVYGSVAQKVLRQAPCATLIIRAQTEVKPFAYNRILVPLDGSELAEHALEPALTLATAMAAELLLLRVTPPAHIAIETLSVQQLFTQLEEMERDEAEIYLKKTVAALANGNPPITIHVTTGSVAETIIDFANTHEVDLIAMSSHGRSGVSRWMYGSVTEKVLHGANCATLVIRGASRS